MEENRYKKLREDYEFKENGRRITMKELSNIFIQKGYTSLTHGAIRKLETGQRKLKNIDEVIAYSKFFNVTADYLLGMRDNAVVDENLAMIGRVTGLSDKSIETLKLWVKESKENQLFIMDELSVLNMILEDYYVLNQKQENHASIFRLISQYLKSKSFRVAPLDMISFRTTDNKYGLIQEGKKIKLSDETNTEELDIKVTNIYDGRAEDYTLTDSDYDAEKYIPILTNGNDAEMLSIELTSSLVETSILNDIKVVLDRFKRNTRTQSQKEGD